MSAQHRLARLLCGAAAGVVCLLSGLGVPSAQESEPPPSPPPADVSEEELRQLMEALGEDAADAEERAPSARSAPAAAPSGGIAGAFQSMNPEIALILDVAASWFTADDTDGLQTGGHDPQGRGFTLQQLELHMGADVDPFFHLDANIVFALFGVEVEEAYGTTMALPGGLQMRLGQFLTRFGRLNPTHPHSWSFVDQPLVNGTFFGSEGSRGLGLELSWLVPTPWYVEVLGRANNADGECCARSFYGADNRGIDGPEDLLYTLGLRQFFDFSDDWSLMWGLSSQFGPNPTGQGNRSAIYGTDLYLRFRPVRSTTRTALSLQTEAMFRSRQVPDGVVQDWGLYTQLVWNIDPEWELGARYERLEGDPKAPESGLDDETDPRTRQRYSLQATFWPSHFSRVRLQTVLDDAPWLEEPSFNTHLALELLIGAHGAHSY